MITIDLANNTLTLEASGILQAYAGALIEDVSWTISLMRQTIGPLVPAKNNYNQTPTYVAPTPEYTMMIKFVPGSKPPLRFRLSQVSNQSGQRKRFSMAQPLGPRS